jgi:hypothetical protein
MASSGGASTRKRTLPQRQPPIIGTVVFVIAVPHQSQRPEYAATVKVTPDD